MFSDLLCGSTYFLAGIFCGVWILVIWNLYGSQLQCLQNQNCEKNFPHKISCYTIIIIIMRYVILFDHLQPQESHPLWKARVIQGLNRCLERFRKEHEVKVAKMTLEIINAIFRSVKCIGHEWNSVEPHK